jgi:hypothetical protein
MNVATRQLTRELYDVISKTDNAADKFVLLKRTFYYIVFCVKYVKAMLELCTKLLQTARNIQ